MAGLSGGEYSKLRHALLEMIEHFENRRDGAKAAATHYPSTAETKLGEADAYDDAADSLRDLFAAHCPK